jgi:hypothetical protein
MYPLSFQFNEEMLTYIAIHVYSRKYGNFLYVTRAITVIYMFILGIESTEICKIWIDLGENREI